MKKQARNYVLESGFQTKAQMRFLLMLMRQFPEKYSWVRDALRDHGVPAEDGPLHTYWEPPYKISPEVPSYIYTGRKKKKKKESSALSKLIKFADKLDDLGFASQADKLDDTIKIIRRDAPKAVANTFWTLRGAEIKADRGNQEKLAKWLDRFNDFTENFDLTSQDKIEAQKYLGDKILGREVE